MWTGGRPVANPVEMLRLLLFQSAPPHGVKSGRAEFVCERPELGDLNVIIQVEEMAQFGQVRWHSTGARIGPSGTRKWR